MTAPSQPAAEAGGVVGVLAELQALLDPINRVNGHVYRGEVSLHLVKRIDCADGFSMSVQADWAKYCSPRDSRGPWHAVEVGFPSARVEAFMPFIDGDQNTDPTGTVYGYVPIKIVAQAIADHGGFARATEPQP